jgi:hypothetical protein
MLICRVLREQSRVINSLGGTVLALRLTLLVDDKTKKAHEESEKLIANGPATASPPSTELMQELDALILKL